MLQIWILTAHDAVIKYMGKQVDTVKDETWTIGLFDLFGSG